MEIPTQSWESTGCVPDGIPTLACLPVLAQNVINILILGSGVVALFLIIYSGIVFITSGGDKEKVEGAKKTLTYAIIGLILIIFSFFILKLISDLTGVKQIIGA